METDYKPGQLPYPEQDERKKFCKYHYKGALIILLPLLFGPILLGGNVLACRMLYLTIVIYLYYILNVMAQGATAFLYIVFLPVLGITGSKPLCVAHYSDTIFVVYGSIFMGIMMDSSKLSQRLALNLLGMVRTRLRCLLIILMIISAVLSTLVSYIFVTAVWMKVAQAAIAELQNAGLIADSEEEPYERQSKPYPTKPVIGIYLAVCYGAILGDMISPFQDPNGVLYDHFKSFSKASGASFVILFGGPMIIGLIIVGLWLNIIFLGLFGGKNKNDVEAVAEGAETLKQAMVDRKADLGPWNVYSILVLVSIQLTTIILNARRPIFAIGWADMLKKAYCGDSVAVILMTIIVFAVPANYIFCRYYVCRKPQNEGQAPSLVAWRIANTNTPWGNIFMLCASYGFCTGLADSTLLKEICRLIKDMQPDSLKSVFLGTFLGSVLTSLAPATIVAKTCLQSMYGLGVSLNIGSGGFGLPFSAGIHNQFLLPISSPASSIVAGWGNIRPFQFLIGGSVPYVLMLLIHCAFVLCLGGAAFDGYDNKIVTA